MLTLRPLEPEDCEVLLSWITSADALFQWSGPWDYRWPLDRAQLQRDLAAAHERRLLFAAVDESGQELLGHLMLTVQPDHRLGVLGRVLVDPDRRGSGLGTALMHEIVRIGFDRLGLHRIQLAVYDFNAAAIACYQRVGFVMRGGCATPRGEATGTGAPTSWLCSSPTIAIAMSRLARRARLVGELDRYAPTANESARPPPASPYVRVTVVQTSAAETVPN